MEIFCQKIIIFFLQKWSIFVKNGNFMSKIVIFCQLIIQKLVISGQFNALKWSIFVKNGNFMSKDGNFLSKITGQFNAFLNKNVQKMVNFCQKW